MSSTDEEYIEPVTDSIESGSFEVIKESYEPPVASWESIKADASSRKTDSVNLSNEDE
jgi:hypothetical protein